MIAEVCLFSAVYTVARLIFWYFGRRRVHRKFSERGIPGPKPSLFDGNLYELRKSKKLPHEVIGDWLKKYGNVVGYYLGEQRYLVINDLDALQQIFMTNTSTFRNRPNIIIDAKPIISSILVKRDEDWRRARRVIQPMFSNAKCLTPVIFDTIQSCVDRLSAKVESISTKVGENGAFEAPFYAPMQATSLDVIAQTALNITTDVHDEKNKLLHAVREYFSEAQNIAIEMATLLPFLRPIMTFINNHMTAGKMTDMAVGHLHKELNEIAKHPIDEKSQNFLHSMVAAFAKGSLNKEELIGNAHIILLAGYETTANAVTYVLYQLAKNQDIQDRLRTYFNNDDEGELDYFDMVWLETLRIMPPVVLFLVRECTEDTVINGISIEKGTVIQVPVWQIHHNEDIYPNPEQFDPERFHPDNKKSIPPMAFVPFGAGPRICLGLHLAFHEAKQIVKRFVTDYRIELGAQFVEPMPFTCSTVFINPANEVTFKFSPVK